MKKLKALLLVCCVMPVMKNHAQVSMEWSQPIGGDTFIAEILGASQTNYFAVGELKKDLFIEGFKRKDLRKKFSQIIELPEIEGVKFNLEDIRLMKDGIITLVSGYDKKNDVVLTYGMKYNTITGKLYGKPLMLSKVEVENKRRKGAYGYKTSKSGDFLLIHHFVYQKKEKTQQFTYTIYDSNLELVSEGGENFVMDDDARAVTISNIIVDNEANIYYYEATSESVNVVSRLFDEEYEKRELEIELSEKVGEKGARAVYAPTLMVNGDYLYIAGYYIETNGKLLGAGINGTFYAKMNVPNNELMFKSTSEFDEKMKRNILTERQIAKDRKIPATFFIKDLILSENGEVVIISESYTVHKANTGRMETTTYTYGDIIVSKVSNEGEILWNQVINKKQIYADTRPVIGGASGGLSLFVSFSVTKDKTIYYSYLVGAGSDATYLIFNDNPKNFTQVNGKTKPLTNPKKGSPAVVIIDDAGNLTKKDGAEMLPEGVILRPKISKQVNNNEVVVYASHKKIEKIGRIIFE